ncbi:MAG: ATPase, T2SS/T4P/T4SS family, partial [Mariprofundaceae bacterium]|nr:ATPase, T2SS/T4P/T4SS family [Mariprofundaceae bacterium]
MSSGPVAMKRQGARYSRLADILLRQNKLTREQLDNVLREMNLAGETLIFQLVKQNIFTSEDITDFISRSFGRPIVDLDQIEIPQNLTAISVDIMRRNKALPIKRTGNMLTLAVADPYDISALDEMAFISGCQVELVIVSEEQLLRHLDSLGTADGHLDDVIADLGANDMEVVDTTEAQLDEHTLTAETEAAPVVKLVNLILLDAIKRGASDIHLEPYEKVVRVRYRIDGVLHEIMRPPIKMRDAIVSRLKILSRLDISERRLPQDGRIKLRLSKTKTVDFRVSVLPTLFGEKVVLRLLDPSSL